MAKEKLIGLLVFLILIVGILSMFLVMNIKTTGKTISNSDIEEIRFVAIPGEEQNEQLLEMQPLADYLSEEIGIPVKIRVATDYTAAIEALKYKHAEMAWLGPFGYLMADEITDVEPLVASIRKGSEMTYQSIIFTRKDSGINSLDDIKGRTFAFNDVGSTSGYLVPMYAFKKAGINPEEDFEEIMFSGSHLASQLAVYNGQVDAGASNLPTYEQLVNQGDIDPNIQRIIWTSEPIPSNPIVVRSDLDFELKRKIQQAFLLEGEKLGIIDGPGNKKFEGFGKVYSNDYDMLRDMAKELGLDLSKVE